MCIDIEAIITPLHPYIRSITVEQIPEITDSLCVSQYKKKIDGAGDSPSLDGVSCILIEFVYALEKNRL